ncbi:response regulator [Hyphomicrobium sp.]|jgi:CheY-like chemotaxis protein|uniref:response regulator n=1 Tax=Hyphomicrobium sp. TaxID=82 RepID=UPI002D80A51E|nr:response regulator [Hyphomicrobium sp.]
MAPIIPDSVEEITAQLEPGMTTILIVDDSKLARIVAGKAVNAIQPKWERVEANNAAEALELVGKRQIDVVLLDFNMPGRNGIELAGDLRRMRPSMPIALLTANIQNEIVAMAKAVDAAFVAKPVTQEGLREFLVNAAEALTNEST